MTFDDLSRAAQKATRWLRDPPRVAESATHAAKDPHDVLRKALETLPDDLSWLVPPQELHAAEPWDRWWRDQLTAQLPLMFVDMFCRDDALLDAIHARGLSTVLCVGSGVSMEPHALTAAGLHVTALDISPVAMEFARQVSNTPAGIERFFKPEHLRPGGSLQFCVGDLTDPSMCPGPYDVIVERKTLQLFPEAERPAAVAAVVARLSENGLFLTHSHNGGWRP